MAEFMTTKEVAAFLKINEKMVYSLVAEKGLPATKVTGKWLFPKHLVEQWLETATVNYPDTPACSPEPGDLLIICGSNDLLLDRTIAFFNHHYPDQVAVFGNLGSMGGLRALRRNLCHVAASHLLQKNKNGYNFEFALKELNQMPAVINFCRREQGLIVAKGNPLGINSVADLAQKNIRIVNRALGTGTRHLFDRELKQAGIDGENLSGYRIEKSRHLDVALDVFAGRADAGPGIRAVAGLLDVGFVPLRWERFDLMVAKQRFFQTNIQQFLNLLHAKTFKKVVESYQGYDVSAAGKMLFPQDQGDQDVPDRKKDHGEKDKG
jgi:putative molybdopterin biosynthesis protein